MQYRNQCPKCHSQYLDGCFMHPHGGNQLERTVICCECGHSWTEIYDIVLVEIKDKQETT